MLTAAEIYSMLISPTVIIITWTLLIFHPLVESTAAPGHWMFIVHINRCSRKQRYLGWHLLQLWLMAMIHHQKETLRLEPALVCDGGCFQIWYRNILHSDITHQMLDKNFDSIYHMEQTFPIYVTMWLWWIRWETSTERNRKKRGEMKGGEIENEDIKKVAEWRISKPNTRQMNRDKYRREKRWPMEQ